MVRCPIPRGMAIHEGEVLGTYLLNEKNKKARIYTEFYKYCSIQHKHSPNSINFTENVP